MKICIKILGTNTETLMVGIPTAWVKVIIKKLIESDKKFSNKWFVILTLLIILIMFYLKLILHQQKTLDFIGFKVFSLQQTNSYKNRTNPNL